MSWQHLNQPQGWIGVISLSLSLHSTILARWSVCSKRELLVVERGVNRTTILEKRWILHATLIYSPAARPWYGVSPEVCWTMGPGSQTPHTAERRRGVQAAAIATAQSRRPPCPPPWRPLRTASPPAAPRATRRPPWPGPPSPRRTPKRRPRRQCPMHLSPGLVLPAYGSPCGCPLALTPGYGCAGRQDRRQGRQEGQGSR